MCAGGQELPNPSSNYFSPSIKCCTYIPDLHNFLVGRILSDDDPAALPGRMTVEKRIKQGVAVTPLGLGKSPVFSTLYNNSDNAFGRSRGSHLRCPHYIDDGGRCGIWRNRESTCATWFCKHVRGKVGQTFWRDSLHQLLRAVESDLARWCVLEHQFGGDALRYLAETGAWRREPVPLTAEAMDDRAEEQSYARIWGQWCGREIDFFVRCADLVTNLSWNDVLAVSGPEAHAYARLTRQAYSRLTSDDIPPRLGAGVMQIVQIGHETTRVVTYNGFDPVDLPNMVVTLLQFFDGRPTEEALDMIAGKTGIRLDRSLVRKLVDFGVLVPPASG
jgi:Fe-S-cluster containining protein